MALSFWTERAAPFWVSGPADARRATEFSAPPRNHLAKSAAERDRSQFLVEALGFERAVELSGAWSDLVSRCLEPNVFMEPGFALAAAQHLARTDRPTFVAVWESTEAGQASHLVGLWGLCLPRTGRRRDVVRLWCHKHAALGLPLLDAERAGAVISAVFGWLREAFPRLRIVVVPKLIRDGPTFARILGYALESGLEWRILDQHERALLTQDGDGLTLSKQRREGLNRRRRQLEARGTVGIVSASDPLEIRNATEAFLALEESGWKGRRRTALLSDGSRAAFARTMTRRLAHEGNCRIDALTLNGTPIAMGIVLRSRDRGFFWKIAYDEAFAPQSPGVQLALEVTRNQQADTTCSMTDSCAIADNPMIDHLWHDRLPIVDIALPLFPAANEAITGFAWRDTLLRRLRAWVGNTVRRARGQTRS
jgi:CelD/BcsL family acetyltransferase involved in cellulose biosynthesis